MLFFRSISSNSVTHPYSSPYWEQFLDIWCCIYIFRKLSWTTKSFHSLQIDLWKNNLWNKAKSKITKFIAFRCRLCRLVKRFSLPFYIYHAPRITKSKSQTTSKMYKKCKQDKERANFSTMKTRTSQICNLKCFIKVMNIYDVDRWIFYHHFVI